MQNQLILLGTQGCHLCELAEHIMQALNLPYQYLDIIDDQKLLDAYETSIPVLLNLSMGHENKLYWPFNEEMVEQWLNKTMAQP